MWAHWLDGMSSFIVPCPGTKTFPQHVARLQIPYAVAACAPGHTVVRREPVPDDVEFFAAEISDVQYYWTTRSPTAPSRQSSSPMVDRFPSGRRGRDRGRGER